MMPSHPHKPFRFCRTLILAAFLSLPAHAAKPGTIFITDAWMRFIIPQRPAAGYFTLRNTGDQALTLTGASSSACGDLMLHRSVHEGGMERMEMVKSIPVPARGSVTFAPGGYHLMCMSPTDALKSGHTVPVTLTFGNGMKITADFAVRNAAGDFPR